MRSRLPLLILAALFPAACASTAASSGASVALPGTRATAAESPIGRPLPEVAVTTLDGTETSVASLVTGKPAIVVLWATWCEACVEEIPSLRRLAPRALAEGAMLVSLSVGEPREKVAAYVLREGMNWPQLVDEPFHFADATGQSRVPAVLVVSAAGEVIFTGGKLDEAALAALTAEIKRGKAGSHL